MRKATGKIRKATGKMRKATGKMRKATGNHIKTNNSLVHTAIQKKKSLDAKDLSSDRELTNHII